MPEPKITPRDAIANCLLMGMGVYATPEDFADAVLKRLAHDGFAVVPLGPSEASAVAGPQPGTWGEFKAEVEAAGVQDDDEIAYFDCGSADRVERYQGHNGKWRFSVE